MKKQFFLLLIVFYSQCYTVNAQVVLQSNDKPLFKTIHQEKIFIHYNSSFLLTGETFYYKLYCLNRDTNVLSNLSKIAYVALVDSDLNEVFKQKIKLESGLGQGDFFIPTSILSGNYKIVAYTQWMCNAGEKVIFQEDISIVNPFNENQNGILSKELDTLNSKAFEFVTTSNNDVSKIIKSNFVELLLDQNKFKNRQKVSLQLNSLKEEEESSGNYSISVRKIQPFKTLKSTSSVEFSNFEMEKTDIANTTKNEIFLPELRGELISGTVVEKATNLPATNVKVSLSISGKEDDLFKMSTTNNLGQFYFNLLENYKQPTATIQLLSDAEKYKINLNPEVSLTYSNLKFSDYKIDTSISDFILKQSINNQIENAYGAVKPTEVEKVALDGTFYNSKEITFNLDDFTRFPTVKETIVEVVDVVTLKHRKGKVFLDVIWANRTYDSGLLPLVLFDGIIIKDHNEIINYNANKIQQIDVVREKYLYGTQIFEGIISFSSINGDFSKLTSDDTAINVVLLKPLEHKKYFKQQYDGTDKLKRIPDYRTQLLWLPNVELNAQTKDVSFFTSDVKGTFEISLEGFTNKGKPVSLKEIIVVE
ncbi:hypothetical protein MKD41_10030 [Lutibacter sp. A64]|uniref:hypothetical protein n=1 Tax=Lutibacter sp. A64 TaxID=2918526 RepID=UPI001F056831|nr:hypothetical protein [Lutibacter sp. A64]UMB52673.1 hypothetical protein MKD41_10030 [Lutibacter sp. A64]